MILKDVEIKIVVLRMLKSCEVIEEPTNKDGDPDTRGSFYDFAGNYWAVSTQTN